MCAAMHTPLRVTISSLITHLLSRLCVTMNGCASVVYLLMALRLSKFIFNADVEKELELFFKVDSDLVKSCSHGWNLTTLTVKVIFISKCRLENVTLTKCS